jgi:hypothetical protein
MIVIQINPSDVRVAKQFLDLPFTLYKDIPQWVPPLSMDARRMLDRKNNPFFRHSEAAFFLAKDENGKCTGRLAILNNRRYNEYNHTNTAFFYLFESENNPSSACEMLNAGCEWAKKHGLSEITGPKGFTALDGMGMLVKGFQYRPAFGIPYNPPYYPSLLEAAGFDTMNDVVSGYLDPRKPLPEKIHRVAEAVQRRKGLRVNRFESRKDLKKFIPGLKLLYNGAVEGTEGNVPLTDEEVDAMASQILWFADPRLIKIITKDNDPVGFLFAYPDISTAVQRTGGRLFPLGWMDMALELRRTKWININGAGILEQYRGMGGTALLFSEMYKSVVEGSFEHADIVQVGVENTRMQNELRSLGIEFYKSHRMYRKSLE